MTCALCAEPAIGKPSRYWFACLEHALDLAGREAEARKGALEARESYREAFRQGNRTLAYIGPPRPAQAPKSAPLELDPSELSAMANVMRVLGGSLLRIETPRYGDMAPTIRATPRPKGPCDVCGSARTVRAVYAVPQGAGAMQVVQCTNLDGCLSRLRKIKRTEEGEAA